MQQIPVRLSRKNQIVVPRRAREALQLRPGDRVYVEIEGGEVSLRTRPADATTHMRGLHKHVWAGVDPDAWLHQERDTWQPAQRPQE